MSTFKYNNIQITGDGNIIIQDVKDSTIHLHIDDKVGIRAFLQKANKELKAELQDRDLSNFGFLGYPVLQAADVLLYKFAHEGPTQNWNVGLQSNQTQSSLLSPLARLDLVFALQVLMWTEK